jgi:photoactive yellow protein
LLDYNNAKLAQEVESLSEDEVNALPFGAIRLNAEGLVIYYSDAERMLSGSGDHPRLGLNFFREIAPCMDNEYYSGRIAQALLRGTLDLEFTHIGDFEDRNRELTVRVQSASDGGYWIFMQRN